MSRTKEYFFGNEPDPYIEKYEQEQCYWCRKMKFKKKMRAFEMAVSMNDFIIKYVCEECDEKEKEYFEAYTNTQ